MRRPVLIAGACVALVVVLAIAIPLLVRHRDPSPGSGGAPTPIGSADLSGSDRGSLLKAMTMPGFAATQAGMLVHAARVTYRSTSGDTGQETVVTGSVFTPVGPAPQGGWPVIAFGHGTTGLDESCAPSLSDSLLGAATIVAGYAHLGYAVALADYQGLGAPGVHPYTDARTAGLNMIDAVRALRRTFPNVSNRWAGVGGSQGGAAAWAADEQAASYAPELDLVGAVAYVPAADVSGIVDKALAGGITTDQSLGFIGVVESLARLHPDLNRDDYRRGAAARYWDALIACSGPAVNDRTDDAEHLRPGDVGPANAQAADKLRGLLKAWAIPQKPLSAPLSVIYAGRDSFIDAPWTTDAIARACALGGAVVWELQSDKGHGDVDVASRFNWLADRFAGIPVTSQCT
jgi:hypothetical protein